MSEEQPSMKEQQVLVEERFEESPAETVEADHHDLLAVIERPAKSAARQTEKHAADREDLPPPENVASHPRVSGTAGNASTPTNFLLKIASVLIFY